MKKELLCRNFVIRNDGSVVELDKLSEKEQKDFAERAGQKMAEAFQKYFSLHPDEL